MEVTSPPKRMTRARAAAKATTSTTASAARATKATAAASAKTKPTTTRTAASMKRKTRADEDEENEESHQTRPATEAPSTEAMNKPARTRGRPRKVVDPEIETKSEAKPTISTESEAEAEAAPAAPRATRGRAKKTAEEPPKPEPIKMTRTRTRKPQADEEKITTAPEATKKTSRGRATSGTASSNAKAAGTICNEATTNPTPGLRSNIVRPASRIGGPTKKSVTFQEPEKENMVPPPQSKAKSKTETESVSGMKAKPVRKAAAAAATRATRATAKTAVAADKKEKPKPLSPKKDGHNRPLSRASNSDDELAAYDKPAPKPLMKSPVKPPNNKKAEFVAPTATSSYDTHEHAHDEDDELAGASVITSPAKRLPSTPFKDTLKSPAKRAEGVPTLLFSNKNDLDSNPSPVKTSILQSPAKRPQAPILAFQAQPVEPSNQPRSPLKTSLFQSPAKRPMSPIKFTAPPSKLAEELVPSSPISNPVSGTERQDGSESEEMEEVEQLQVEQLQEELATEEPAAEAVLPTEMVGNDEDGDDIEMSQNAEVILESPNQLEFPGRLSAVLPRHADPALRDKQASLEAQSATQLEPSAVETKEVIVVAEPKAAEPAQADVMDVDEAMADGLDRPNSPPAESLPRPAVRPANPMFGLREKDLLPVDNDDSEDELVQNGPAGSTFVDDDTLTFAAVPATPTPAASRTPRSALPTSAIKNAGRAIRSVSRASKLGFTPLAKQLSDWRSGSPLKNSHVSGPDANSEEYSLIEDSPTGAGQSPAKGTFFDDEMRIRAEMDAGIGIDGEAEAEMMAAIEADLAAHFDDPEFDDIPVTNEDVELAAEANEMSLLEPEQAEEVLEIHAHDDSISESSQEYGDENAIPIDPALQNLPVTPVRPSSTKTFNTTTKVPLKPADDSTPKSMKRRSASASRVPAKRPAGPTRNATVISYSPTKESDDFALEDDEQDDCPPVTPAKTDIWSSIGTPARTPRRDLNPGLLRGAVVFVDVHTSEGADASAVFVELLTQMGARCVKSWPWNPNSPDNGDPSSSKVGITHVVYKDGGKRTMEKVRESGGVVQCVGVSWVLDCERENEWLDESPYYIDTSLVPRGGARRRKSMEPKALANLNGTLVTPMKQTTGAARDCQTVPNNHMSRRDSTAWMRSPSNPGEDEDMEGVEDDEWDGSMLTPVPKTPAPEALHRYVTEMEVTPDTPTAEWSDEYSPEKEQMLTRTAPPKQSTLTEIGQGLLSQHKDQSVMMRLMAARRKSMQFAPKIASPLSKAWN